MSIRNNLHTEKGLAIYAQGMCNSSSDKARINQHLVPGTILEIGCGNGAYLQTLSDDRLAQTTAIDMNAHLLQMAADNLGPRSKNVTFCRADVLRNDFPGGSFDNIVMCSVLHELYSELRTKYLSQGETTAESCARFDLQAMLYRVYKALAPGGALIIRDGVQPPNDNAVLKFKVYSIPRRR